MKAINEFLLTPGLAIAANSKARWANFVAQSHHAHHSAAAGTSHTSLYTSASLPAVGSAPTRAPTVQELEARAQKKQQSDKRQRQQQSCAQKKQQPNKRQQQQQQQSCAQKRQQPDKRQQQQQSQQACLSAIAANAS
jgi:hypothetical protein